MSGFQYDGRTTEGIEERTLAFLTECAKNGTGTTVFWCTENQKRACAVDSLQKAGKVVLTAEGYPNYKVEVKV